MAVYWSLRNETFVGPAGNTLNLSLLKIPFMQPYTGPFEIEEDVSK